MRPPPPDPPPLSPVLPPEPESAPFEQFVKTSAAPNSKTHAIIGMLFKRALPSSPSSIQMYSGHLVYTHHKPPLKTFIGSAAFTAGSPLTLRLCFLSDAYASRTHKVARGTPAATPLSARFRDYAMQSKGRLRTPLFVFETRHSLGTRNINGGGRIKSDV